jgi:hypothetical protein
MGGFNPFRSYQACSRSFRRPGQKLLFHCAVTTYFIYVFTTVEDLAKKQSKRKEIATGSAERLQPK